jgi:hypothetical protein
MNIKDLLSEGRTGSLQDDVADALPAAFTVPQLKNTDPYMQYRYGLAIASAHRISDPDPYNIVAGREDFAPTSAWGENLIVASFTPKDIRTLELASKLMGVTQHQISTTKSQETPDVNKKSPVKPIK